ncbi:transcriptional regulator [Streptomyces sp. NL15-2K]|nr:transcriptional regulator [Streptomyces sp. NL15-2K]
MVADRSLALVPLTPHTAEPTALVVRASGPLELLAGVAKQLDLGLRTVQRRVKRLMELSGVTTRLQLGWHACERGWVARDRPE